MIMDDIEHLDTKQYEDLKLEYIRRKMAKQTQDDEQSVGGSTMFTHGSEQSKRGAFRSVMDFIFNESGPE